MLTDETQKNPRIETQDLNEKKVDSFLSVDKKKRLLLSIDSVIEKQSSDVNGDFYLSQRENDQFFSVLNQLSSELSKTSIQDKETQKELAELIALVENVLKYDGAVKNEFFDLPDDSQFQNKVESAIQQKPSFINKLRQLFSKKDASAPEKKEKRRKKRLLKVLRRTSQIMMILSGLSYIGADMWSQGDIHRAIQKALNLREITSLDLSEEDRAQILGGAIKSETVDSTTWVEMMFESSSATPPSTPLAPPETLAETDTNIESPTSTPLPTLTPTSTPFPTQTAIDTQTYTPSPTYSSPLTEDIALPNQELENAEQTSEEEPDKDGPQNLDEKGSQPIKDSTETVTVTPTLTPSETLTETITPDLTMTSTEFPTFTSTATEPTLTSTNLPSSTSTPFPTFTPNETSTLTQTPTETATERPTSTATETFTAEPTSTIEPTRVPIGNELDTIAGENMLVTEYVLGEVYETVKEARELRLGLRQSTEIPEGYKRIEHNGLTFDVPENLHERWYFVYDPRTFAESMGLLEPGVVDARAQAEAIVNSDTINILIAGLDYRPEYSGGIIGFVGRTDSPIVLRFNRQTGEVIVISIARDTHSPEVQRDFGNSRENSEISVSSWVHSQGNALAMTDPAYQRYITEQITGIPIDGVAQLNFVAVGELLSILAPDGVTVTSTIPTLVDDGYYKLIIDAGQHTLSGMDLVNFARSRYQATDLDRQSRQRQVLIGTGRELFSTIKRDPSRALTLLSDIETALLQMEDARIALDNDPSTAEFRGYIRSFGLSPTIMIRMAEQMLDVEGAATLGLLMTKPENQALFQRVMAGGGFSQLQISHELTTPSNNDLEYWAPARAAVAQLLLDEPATTASADVNLEDSASAEILPPMPDWLRNGREIASRNPYFNTSRTILAIGDSNVYSDSYLELDRLREAGFPINEVIKIAGNGWRADNLDGTLSGQSIADQVTADPDKYPSMAILWFGVNDILYRNLDTQETKDAWYEALDNITRPLVEKGIVPIISLVPPITRGDFTENSAQKINIALIQYAQERGFPVRTLYQPNSIERARYENILPLAPEQDIITSADVRSQDGVHLSPTDYREITDFTAQVLGDVYGKISGEPLTAEGSIESQSSSKLLTWDMNQTYDQFLESAGIPESLSNEGGRFIRVFTQTVFGPVEYGSQIPVDYLHAGYALWKIAFPENNPSKRDTTYAPIVIDVLYSNARPPFLEDFYRFYVGMKNTQTMKDLLDDRIGFTTEDRRTIEGQFESWLADIAAQSPN